MTLAPLRVDGSVVDATRAIESRSADRIAGRLGSAADPGEDAREQADQGDGQEHQVVAEPAGLDAPAPVAERRRRPRPTRFTRPSTASLSKTPSSRLSSPVRPGRAVDHAVDDAAGRTARRAAARARRRPDEDGVVELVEVPLVDQEVVHGPGTARRSASGRGGSGARTDATSGRRSRGCPGRCPSVAIRSDAPIASQCVEPGRAPRSARRRPASAPAPARSSGRPNQVQPTKIVGIARIRAARP